jgi:translation initiation factor 2B subunit (eIF-2B alpha/beta/delta family)
VVNKVGSLAVALTAERFGVPFLVVASTDKVSPDDGYRNEYVGYEGARVPVFERVAPDLVTLVTEEGEITEDEVRDTADEHGHRREGLR